MLEIINIAGLRRFISDQDSGVAVSMEFMEQLDIYIKNILNKAEKRARSNRRNIIERFDL